MFWPIPSTEVLTAFYAAHNTFSEQGRAEAEAYLQDPAGVRTSVAGFGRDLGANGVSEGVVVNLGCSYGPSVIEISRLGYEAWGVDLSPDAMDWLNANGGRGHCGTLDDFPVPQIDALYSSHTLEHMADPYAVLRRAHKLLRPGGYMELALPNWGGLVAQSQMETWKWFTYPAHIHYFRLGPFLRVLTGMGFEIISAESSSLPHEPREVAQAFGAPAAEETIRAILSKGLGESMVIKTKRL